MKKFFFLFFLLPLFFLSLCYSQSTSTQPGLPLPELNISLRQTDNPSEFTSTLQVFIILTVLSIAPSFLIMMTSFTRFIVVFSFLRQGLAIPQIPPNQVLAGLALFLTFFVMAPIIKSINEEALQPYLTSEIGQREAFEKALSPIRDFMLRQTRTDDIQLMQRLSGLGSIESKADLPTHVLIPSFIISELTTAFTIGFLLFIPFLVIDMVVASILMAMGMLMVPPISISLPFKILLFVLVDGWNLLIYSLVSGIKG